MKYRGLLFNTIIALSFLLFLPNYGQVYAELPNDVQELIKTRIKEEIYPGVVVGLIDENGPRYYCYGKTSINGDTQPDEHTVYEIGSITKTFTALLLSDMVSKGEVALNDPISKYLPAGVIVPNRNGKSITLAHLATHTSGLPRLAYNKLSANPNDPYIDYSEKQMTEFLATHTLRRNPGEQYEYSNYGYGLLGNILMHKNGSDHYDELYKQRIGDVLDLKETGVTLTADMQNRLAGGTHNLQKAANWHFTSMAGCGALRSTAHDMLRVIAANMGMYKTALHDAMLTSQIKHTNNGMSKEEYMGLGWHIMLCNDKELVWQNGGTGGYRSFAGFIKGGNTGVIVLTNATANVDDIGFHLLNSSMPLQKIALSGIAEFFKNFEHRAVEDIEPEVSGIIHECVNDIFTGTMRPDHYIPELWNTIHPHQKRIQAENMVQCGAVEEITLVNRKDAGDMKHYSYIIECEKSRVLVQFIITPQNKIAAIVDGYFEFKADDNILTLK